MKSNQIIILVISFFLGMLLLNMFQNVCGCEVKEGFNTTGMPVHQDTSWTACNEALNNRCGDPRTINWNELSSVCLEEEKLFLGCSGATWDNIMADWNEDAPADELDPCNQNLATFRSTGPFEGRCADTNTEGEQDLCADNNCSGHGSCDSGTGACKCDDGYTGTNCETPSNTAPCPVDTDGVECSAHGSCDSGEGACACEDGYTGTNCETQCEDGYTGTNCVFRICSPRPALRGYTNLPEPQNFMSQGTTGTTVGTTVSTSSMVKLGVGCAEGWKKSVGSMSGTRSRLTCDIGTGYYNATGCMPK